MGPHPCERGHATLGVEDQARLFILHILVMNGNQSILIEAHMHSSTMKNQNGMISFHLTTKHWANNYHPFVTIVEISSKPFALNQLRPWLPWKTDLLMILGEIFSRELFSSRLVVKNVKPSIFKISHAPIYFLVSYHVIFTQFLLKSPYFYE